MAPSRSRSAKSTGRSSVRIVGGAWRGRRVQFPVLAGLRPTPDRVRETLFNWLQFSLQDALCLDLYAGSGVLGLEALSRGARSTVFVEQDAAVALELSNAIEQLGAADRTKVVTTTAQRFLAAPAALWGGPFDVVFLDPPFHRQALPEISMRLEDGEWIKPGGLIYLESEKAARLPALPAGWEVLKAKSAGEVGYHLARRATADTLRRPGG